MSAARRGSAGRTRRGGSGLAAKEAAYLKLNAELQAKSDSLAQEAEQVMRRQERLLSGTNLTFDDSIDDQSDPSLLPRRPATTASTKSRKPRTAGSASGRRRPSSSSATRPRPRPASGPSSSARRVAGSPVPAHPTVETAAAAPETEDAQTFAVEDDPALAAILAGELGEDATIRVLKAKLRVAQEDLGMATKELSLKTEAASRLETRVKALEKDQKRHERTSGSAHGELTRAKRQLDDITAKAEQYKSANAHLKKDIEALERAAKKDGQSRTTVDMRLNKALEEIEVLKARLQEAQRSQREAAGGLAGKVELLEAEKKALQKQKLDLVNAFKAQLKLIDVLKRQKLHLEAAKMLSFSEAEFAKALEWGA